MSDTLLPRIFSLTVALLVALLTFPFFIVGRLLLLIFLIICSILQVCLIPALPLYFPAYSNFLETWQGLLKIKAIAPVIKHRKRCICGTLLVLQAVAGTTLAYNSIRMFVHWWTTTHKLHRDNDLNVHLALLIFTCAPICGVLGVGVGTLYYMRMRGKYGKFDLKMRRKGRRGYFLDPRDKEEKEKADQAKKLNAEGRGKSVPVGGSSVKLTSTAPNLSRPVDASLTPQLQPQPPQLAHSKRMSMFSPYGWGISNPLHHHRTPHSLPLEVEKNEISQSATPSVRRSDSIRTCKNDPVTKRGVMDIWLSGITDKGKKGYDGRAKRKENWDEEMKLKEIERKE